MKLHHFAPERWRWQAATSLCLLFTVSAWPEVRVSVQESNSLAWVRYECTAGEVVRAFALDVIVDKGRILGIGDFLRGFSTAANPGYGVFPAAFRDHIQVGPGTNVDWNVSAYTPLAAATDNPNGTQPGLNSSGVTLEFGGLWDPGVSGAVPGPMGTLCSLRISERASVSIAANSSRGGVVSTDAGVVLTPEFSGAVVQPPEITNVSASNGVLLVTFAGGELETAADFSGPWVGSGNASGQYVEAVIGGTSKFFRVRSP